MIGSEGTLGIITKLTLRLHPIPEKIASGMSSFPSIKAACNAVITTIRQDVHVARLEMLDALHVRACNAYSKMDLPEKPLLIVEFRGTPETVNNDTVRFTGYLL